MYFRKRLEDINGGTRSRISKDSQYNAQKKKKRDKQLPTKHNAENKIRAPRISLKTDVNSSVLKTNNICNLYSQSKQ